MKQFMLNDLKNNRGFILIVVYLVAMLVTVFSFAFFGRANAFQIAAEHNQNKIIAFNMAEAGVDATLAELLEDINYTPEPGNYTPLDTDFVKGGYSVTVSSIGEGSNTYMISSTGYAPINDLTARAFQCTSITAYVESAPDSLFRFAVFAENSITISTSASDVVNFDSYDSGEGAYGGDNVGSNADIGTNSTEDDCITIKGGDTTINGDATIGPEGDVEDALDVRSGSDITGTEAAATEPQTLYDPSTEEPVSPAVSLHNSTLNLSEGTYHFSSLSISGTGQIVTTGEVKIYVDGTVNIGGQGIVNTGQSPPDLLLYATEDATITISGSGSFYGGIYAPNSWVKNTGSGAIYGAIVAEDYQQQGNGAVHFDEAMNDVAGLGSSGVSVKAWSEETSLAWNTGTAPSAS